MEHDLAKPWFRLYSEFVSDPKVQLLAFEDQRHFIALLCLKCNETLDSQTPSKNHRERMVAKALGLDPASAIEAKRRLHEVGLIDTNWQPTRWESRQYQSDSSTSRVRQWREKRYGNVAVTDKSRADTEQSRAEQTQSVIFDGWKFIESRMRPNYPEGDYPDTAWIAAARNVERIVDSDGLPVLDTIEAGCKRFLAQAVAKGDVGGAFIVNPDRFLTERRWTKKFAIPPSKAQQQQDANISAAQAFLNRDRSSALV